MTEPSLIEVLDRWFPADPADAAAPADLSRHLRAVGLDGIGRAAAREAGVEARLLGLRFGLGEDQIFAIAQAYGRAVGRVVDAESEVVRLLIRDLEPEQRACALEALLATTRPLASELWTVLHEERGQTALRDARPPDHLLEPTTPPRAVALVDHVASTRFLAEADAAATTRFVDALFEAAAFGTAGRPVQAVKFVGDGVYLVGRDAGEVADAAGAVLERLDAELPPARAGLAMGPVVRRAGDYFGLAVNVASRLAELAPVGCVLADGELDSALRQRVRGRQTGVALRGIPGTRDCVILAPC